MSSPAPPECLSRPYHAKPHQRGGTLIAEDVVDLDEHRRRLADVDGYRPPRCLHCHHDRLHAHDLRERHRRGEGLPVKFRRYRCAACGGVWLVLAAFMARHLHRSWAYVEAATAPEVEGERVQPPRRGTLSRWVERLRSSGRLVVQVLVASGVELRAAAEARCRSALLLAMVREKLLSAGRAMAELAGWLHRLVPGLRLL